MATVPPTDWLFICCPLSRVRRFSRPNEASAQEPRLTQCRLLLLYRSRQRAKHFNPSSLSR